MSTKTVADFEAPAPAGPAEGALATFDTPIDLAGNPDPERLRVLPGRVAVGGGQRLNEQRRHWSLASISAFRIEPSIGSCYLQAELAGRWTDVLRWPGAADRSLTELAEHLNVRCRQGRWPETDPSADGAEGALGEAIRGPRAEGHAKERWRTLHHLRAMVRPFRGSIAMLLALSVGAVAVDLAPPMLQRFLVDEVLKANPSRAWAQPLLLLMAVVAGLLMFRMAATAMGIAKGYVSSRVGTMLTAGMRDELVRKLNQLPLAFHDRHQVGMLMSRVSYDTETMHTVVHHLTSGFLLQSLQMIGIGVALFYLNPKLAAVTLLPMPLIVVGSWYFTRYLSPRHNHYWDAVGRQASSLAGMLSGIRVVKAFAQEDRETERFSVSSRRLRDSRQTVDISTATFSASMGFVFALGGLAVWYIGGRDVLGGTMSLGSLMAFLAYLAMFYTPLTSIAESTTWFSNFFTAMRRILEVLDAPDEREDPERATPLPGGNSLEFRQVLFGYDKSRPVLRDVSFSIRAGEMIGVVGRSGSGKSTLVSLIGRMYEPDAGKVLLGGVDVRGLDRRQLRRRIGMVPQEPFLFRGTIAANITYGNTDATARQILQAARSADAHDFIMRKPFGYETQLGEGGSGLSVGERQRLSIARALLFDPEILILDEATASVDAETERAICDAIRRFSRGRTSIIIAHRLSTLRDADRLIVFDQGTLIEQGTHGELLARDGLYATLVRLQWDLDASRQRAGSLLGRETEQPGALLDLPPEETLFTPSGNGPRRRRPKGEGADPELRWLDPGEVTIAADGSGALRVRIGKGDFHSAYAVRAFPGEYEREFITLRRRDASDHDLEVGMIDTLNRWPPGAQEAILASLRRRHFFRRLTALRQVRILGNLLEISAEIEGRPAVFRVEKPGEGFQPFGPRGLLLRDGQDNYYVLPDRDCLSSRQQRLLTLYFVE
jgi:ATP-binding cassette subfamily B protein